MSVHCVHSESLHLNISLGAANTDLPGVTAKMTAIEDNLPSNDLKVKVEEPSIEVSEKVEESETKSLRKRPVRRASKKMMQDYNPELVSGCNQSL